MSISGRVRISSAAISDSINVEEISSPVKCSNGALDLENITAQISGGEIHGNFHADLTNSGLPYRMHFEVSGVNINEIVSRAGGILDRAHGILQGSFQLAGYMKRSVVRLRRRQSGDQDGLPRSIPDVERARALDPDRRIATARS